TANLLQTGRHEAPGDGDGDFAVVMAQVAIVRAGAEVDPFADVTVPQEAIVILVHVAVKDRRLDLASHAAVRPNGRTGADPGAQDLRARADIARPLQPTEGRHHRLPVDNNRAPQRVGDHEGTDARRSTDTE